jgi:hypothetical protein
MRGQEWLLLVPLAAVILAFLAQIVDAASEGGRCVHECATQHHCPDAGNAEGGNGP